MGSEIWQRIWKIGQSIGISFSWNIGGPTPEERREQERRADEVKEQQKGGFIIRDTRGESKEG